MADARAKRDADRRLVANGEAPSTTRRMMRDIHAPDLSEVLQKVEACGKYERANRLRGTLSSLFRFAIATGRVDRDPDGDLRGALIAPKVTHRAAITDPAKVGGLLRSIDGYDGSKIVRSALLLSAHLFMRLGELRLASWSEFDFEIGIWAIPAERTKMRRPHKVPLTDQVLSLFEELDAMTGQGSCCFPVYARWTER